MGNNEEHVAARNRLIAVRAFHPAPWRVRCGVLVDGDGEPVDLDLLAVRAFLENVLHDLQSLTEPARRRANSGEFRQTGSTRPSLRAPSAPPSAEVLIDVPRTHPVPGHGANGQRG